MEWVRTGPPELVIALLSAPRRSAEEYVAEDWSAVSRAINQRMTELRLSQRALIARSQVSKATVGELQRNSAQRRRSARTLEALSIALEWHPDHLLAVLTGRHVPAIGQPPISRSDDDVYGRLVAIENRLDQMATRLEVLDNVSVQLEELNAHVEKVVGPAFTDRKNERR